MRGQVDRPGQSVEDARPLADRSRIEAVGGHARFARENDDADFFAAGVELRLRALLQRPRLEADIAPAGAGRGDAMADAGGRPSSGMNQQFRLRHDVRSQVISPALTPIPLPSARRGYGPRPFSHRAGQGPFSGPVRLRDDPARITLK